VQISNPLDIENIQEHALQPISEFPEFNTEPFIVSAGRLSRGKGFIQLIQVYANSLIHDKCHLVILGYGPLIETLESDIKKLGMEKRIHLVGYQKNPYRFFSKARYLVLNSNKESFGNVLIEAFACGIPVVSNDCDFGPRDIIIPDVNGLLYNQVSDESLKNSLEEAFLNVEKYEKMKAGAIASREKYRVSTIVDSWMKLLLN
jgi:N-acetylgalactosamine-N,N'-diacetylbacillosaminyl-diphospho-undecaprenol 4-alpha-N-acetylgalactosaminyltransferase